MNSSLLWFLSSVATSGSEELGQSASGEGIKKTLLNLVKNPVFYVVTGSIVVLIIVVYLIRRIVKPRPNTVVVIVRRGLIYKLIDEKSSAYFRIPFVDKIGAAISLDERELSSDKLFINNGPDALYQINYTLKYKVININLFYKYLSNIHNLITSKINDDLREFADTGNALTLVKEYRQNSEKIISLVNKAVEPFGVETFSFKINLVQPLGR